MAWWDCSWYYHLFLAFMALIAYAIWNQLFKGKQWVPINSPAMSRSKLDEFFIFQQKMVISILLKLIKVSVSIFYVCVLLRLQRKELKLCIWKQRPGINEVYINKQNLKSENLSFNIGCWKITHVADCAYQMKKHTVGVTANIIVADNKKLKSWIEGRMVWWSEEMCTHSKGNWSFV